MKSLPLTEIGMPSVVSASADANRLPSLDGLRALSIALVLIGHLSGTRGFHRLYPIGDYAHLGVVVFFVISGYLITRLLLQEHAKFGRVSLRNFYARRALRLLPAAYTFILCVVLLWVAGLIHLSARDIWHALTYTVNFEVDRVWYIGHLWSLSVEEQFYLLWPIAFVLLLPRRATWAAFAAFLIGPATRLAMVVLLRGSPIRDLEIFPMVADSLATGCLLALTGKWLETQNWYLRLFKPVIAIGMLLSVFVINYLMGWGIVFVFGTSVINVFLAILIHRSVYCHRDWFGQFLNYRPVAFIGVLSYSLYLWQQLFINRSSASWVCAFPFNLIFAVAAALASYYLLERPLLGLRHKLRIRQTMSSPGPMNLEICKSHGQFSVDSDLSPAKRLP